MSRILTYTEALREAQDICLSMYPEVFIMGLGVPDPKGIFGSTLGLQDKYGPERVFDIPLSENAITGIAIGAAISGMRPIFTHQRVDFALVAMEQMVNQAANWHYMFGGTMRVPLVIRMIIGRGWGQGPQHSQSLQALFAHIPGLKVVMPTTPFDAKGLLVSSVQDNNPVIFLEHRWLHNISDHVPDSFYSVELGKARVIRSGNDLTIVSSSYMTLESLKAADFLAMRNIEADVIDLRTIKPFDLDSIITSVTRTGHLLVVDHGWQTCGYAAEIITSVIERSFHNMKSAPQRLTLPDCPTPTSHALDRHFYPRAINIANKALEIVDPNRALERFVQQEQKRLDVPDNCFTGPF